MAEEPDLVPIDNVEPEETPGYTAPAQKTLDEIAQLDQDDESLRKYKETLLAGVDADAAPKDDPRRVVVEKMMMVVEGRPDVEFDLRGDLSKLKESPVVVKEGAEYRLKILFRVQHEIVSGLRYHHLVSRKMMKKDITVHKQSYMVGSYGPKAESYSFLCPIDDAPKGRIARAEYSVKSKFFDDDENNHLEWQWSMQIKKDWE